MGSPSRVRDNGLLYGHRLFVAKFADSLADGANKPEFFKCHIWSYCVELSAAPRYTGRDYRIMHHHTHILLRPYDVPYFAHLIIIRLCPHFLGTIA